MIAVDRVQGNVAAHHILTENIATLVAEPERGVEFRSRIKGILEQNEAAFCGLINNAAVQILGGVESLTAADWHETLDTNLVAPFVLAQLFLPELESSRGAIVNISSIHEN